MSSIPSPAPDPDLVHRLIACSEEQFTGWLSISTVVFTAQEERRREWGLRFFLGRLIGERGGVHGTRRWRRQLTRQCPQLKPEVIQPLAHADVKGLHYQTLIRGVRDRQLRREQAVAVIEGSLAETLFDLLQQEDLLGRQGSAFDYAYSPEESLAALDAAMIPVQVRYVLRRAQKLWQEWREAGLQDRSPNLAPVIQDTEQLRQKTSAAAFRNLCTLVDGRRTLRDLAVKVGQDPLLVTQSLLPYLKTGIMSWTEILDLKTPCTPITQPLLPELPEDLPQHPQVSARGPLVAYVEDSPLDGRLMEQVLAQLGCRSVLIPNPLQALTTVLEQKPDLILLDLVMPIQSGYEICGQMRRISALRGIPVIIVTSSDGLVDRVRAKMVGASGFMAKPIETTQVMTALVSHGLIQKDPQGYPSTLPNNQDPLMA